MINSIYTKVVQSILSIRLPIPHWLLLISNWLLLISNWLLSVPNWLAWNHDWMLRCHIRLNWLKIRLRRHMWLTILRKAYNRLRHLRLTNWIDSLTTHHRSLMNHHVLLHLHCVQLHISLHIHLLLGYYHLMLSKHISLDSSD